MRFKNGSNKVVIELLVSNRTRAARSFDFRPTYDFRPNNIHENIIRF